MSTGLDLYGDDKTVVAVRVDGEVRDLHLAIDPSTGSGHELVVEPVSIESEEGLAILRHSAAHVLAQAVQAAHADAKLGIGPPITDGFYYDFDVAEPFTPEDLKNLEKAMTRIVKERQRFRRRVVTDAEARTELAAEPYKLELIADKGSTTGGDDGADLKVGTGELTIYDNLRRDDSVAWKDLCRGPHVPHTGYIPAFALTRVSAAYWRGDQANPQLQRIYGTAWPSRDELKAYQFRQAEAAKRDHRKLGRRARPVLLSRRAGLGPGGVPPQGRRAAQGDGGLRPAAARRGGVRVRQHPAHHQGGPVRDLGAPRLLRRGHVPADAPRRGAAPRRPAEAAGAGLLPQAHELPDALPDLPGPRPVLPRAAAAAVRVRRRLPVRVVRRHPRPHPRPGDDPGRCAHLLHPGAAAGRDHLPVGLRPRAARRLRLVRLLPGALHPGPGEVDRHGRGVGAGHRGAAAGGRRLRTGAGARPRRRRLLRPEDLACRPATPSAGPGSCRPSRST